MQSYSDEQLFDVFKSSTGGKSRKAFDLLYMRYLEPLTQYFYFALFHDYNKGKDFVHDLFLKLLEHPDQFDTKKKFKPWVYQVAANSCKNYYRKNEVAKKYEDFTLNTSDHSYQLEEQPENIKESIKKLKHEQRSLIVLRFKLNMTVKEISSIYECPEGTIKSRLFYATKELSKIYKP